MDHTVDIADVNDELVRDAMVVQPKTLASTAPVSQAQQMFENPRVKVALVVEGDRFLGEVTREAALAAQDLDAALSTIAQVREVVGPDTRVSDAMELIRTEPGRRLPVVDPSGALVGLVCVDASGTALCVG